MKFLGILICLTILVASCPSLQAASNGPSSLLSQLQGKQFFDSKGKVHRTAEWKDRRAIVFVFIGIDCPISNRYSPELNSIYTDYSKQGILLYGVHADRSVTMQQAQTHAAEYSLQFPILLDSSLELAKILGAQVTPEAVVLSGAGVPLYRGRIDNLYVSLGQMRTQATVNDLRAVLDNVVSGKSSPFTSSHPVGCFIPSSR